MNKEDSGSAAEKAQKRPMKILLDASLFMEWLLDPQMLERSEDTEFDLEVPGAFVVMIQYARVGDSLLEDLLYAYSAKQHQEQKSQGSLTASLGPYGDERRFLKKKAAKAVEHILNVYAPLIEGALEPVPVSYSESYSNDYNGVASDSYPPSSFVPNNYPISRYDAFDSESETELTKLRKAYTNELNLKQHPLLDLFFLQMDHGQQIGIASSPVTRREIIAFGHSTHQVLTRFVSGEFNEELISLVDDARDTLRGFTYTYIRPELQPAVLGGMFDLTLSLYTTGQVNSTILVSVIGNVVVGAVLRHRLGLSETQIFTAMVIIFAIAILLVLWSPLRQPEVKTVIIQVTATSRLASPTSIFATSQLTKTPTQVTLSSPTAILVHPSPTPLSPVRTSPTPVPPSPTPSSMVSEEKVISIPPTAASQINTEIRVGVQTADHELCKYVVQPGDTYASIASRFQVAVEDLRTTFNLPVTGAPQLHQTVIVNSHCCTPIGGNGFAYQVQTKERLYRLALQYNTTVQKIANANGIQNVDYIQDGQMLCIPLR